VLESDGVMIMKKEIMKKGKNLLIQKRYSTNIQKISCHYFDDLISFFRSKDLDDTVNEKIDTMKSYYKKVLGIEKRHSELHSFEKEHKLSRVLSKQEVERIFDVTNMLQYSFATYLLTQMRDSQYIQELLEHNSSKTIESYTYASKQATDKIKNHTADFFE
jgi:site-specific recombinase XerD